MMNTVKTWIAVVAAATASLAACGADGDSSKAGNASFPVTLRVGTVDGAGSPAAAQLEELARQVDASSDGTVRLEPVLKAGGEDVVDVDQRVGRMVVSGELDMALVPAQAWDTEGVTSLRALHAPFLVTSEALFERVVTSELARQMLAGLEEIDLTGLALIPEGLRHVFVFGDPDQVSFDLADKVVWTTRSETLYALYSALGATPDSSTSTDRARGVEDGTIDAAASSFSLAGFLPAASSASGNMTLYPKANSIVINDEAFEALADDQQRALQDAAARTVEWAVEEMPSEADGAAVFCRNGGRVVNAPEAVIAAATNAAQPVYDELERDETTKALIERIRAIKQELPEPSTIAPCGPQLAAPVAEGAKTGQGEFPDGVYRMELPIDALLEAGIDAPTAGEHAATWEITFEDGRLTVKDTNTGTGRVTTMEGVYCVADGRVTLGLLGNPPACGDFWNAAWEVSGDTLRFVDVMSDSGFSLLLETIFGSTPFTKIG
jgi:TRAP-type C4-dicarboxylate transport system substrate-binding protein